MTATTSILEFFVFFIVSLQFLTSSYRCFVLLSISQIFVHSVLGFRHGLMMRSDLAMLLLLVISL
jgi:hypothetical protein